VVCLPFSPEKRRAYDRAHREDRHRTNYYREHRESKPFVGVDGEGWGSTYALLADSGGHSIHDYEGLPTRAVFDWLVRLRERNGPAHFVGFALGYDTNHWLRDLPNHALYSLWRTGRVRWEDWWMEWTVGKWFHLRHLPSGRGVRIWDAFGFFQGSFLKACADWGIEVPPEVRAGKEARGAFTSRDLPRIIAYNAVELRTLVVLMNRLREGLTAAGITGTQWYGAGAAASRLFQLNGVRKAICPTPPKIQHAVLGAYFGGRIEAGKFGRIEGPIWNGDVNSAYPHEMSTLPNLSLGEWEQTREWSPLGVYLSEWDWPDGSPYYPLPWRDRDGSIYFPRVGRSWVWAPEVKACAETGWPLAVLDGWVWHQTREPTEKTGPLYPYAFLAERYKDRLRLGKKTGGGQAIKLSLNATYGKTAQRDGHYGPPTYRQFEVAGLITSATRARLWSLASTDLTRVISFNTDGLYAQGGDFGRGTSEELGAITTSTYAAMEVAEPGVYRLLKADGTWENYGRGFGKGGVRWAEWKAARSRGAECVMTRVPRFHGLGECLRETGGRPWVDRKKWRTWETVPKKLAIKNPSKKRLGEFPFNPTFGLAVLSTPHDPRMRDGDSDDTQTDPSLAR
jgi:hypothetical protein